MRLDGSGRSNGKGGTHANGNGNGNGFKGNGSPNGNGGVREASWRALITGGAGFIGSHLAEHLVARGVDVTAMDDLSTGSFGNIAHLAERSDFRFVCESVTNEAVMDRLVSDCDVIYHLAAAVGVDLIIKNPVQTIETNVLGTEAVLRLARRYHKKVLIASTSEVYGKSDNHPYREDDDRVLGPTTRSRWAYAESKALDEFLALAYHKEYRIPVVVTRLFNTVGPRQTGAYGMVIPRLAQQAVEGRPLTVYSKGRQSRCFCDVRDVVPALVGLTLCPAAEGEIFNIGSEHEITILDLARRILHLSGSSSPIEFVPYERAYHSDFEDMHRRVPNIERIRGLIGWEPRTSLDQTLEEVIAEFRARADSASNPGPVRAASVR